MAIITISRLVGANGDRIAQRVANELGYDCVDNALIVQVAEEAGVSVQDAARVDERYESRAAKWLKAFITPRTGKIIAEEGKHLNPESFIRYCTEAIKGLAERGNVIIVGRGGQYILADYDTAFHVRIIADEESRVRRIMETRLVGKDTAVSFMHKSDKMRRHFLERYFNADWHSHLPYHLVLNSSKLGVDLTVTTIVDAVRDFSAAFEYIPGVRDRRSGRDRRRGERRRGERREATVGWTRKNIGATIMREGRPLRNLSRPDRRRHERRKKDRRSDGT